MTIEMVRIDRDLDQSLPFAKACEAVFSDPPPTFREVLQDLDGKGKLAGLEVEVKDVQRYGSNLFNFRTSKSYSFRVISGACITLESGEAS